jgi:transposase
LAELTKQFDVYPAQISAWKQQLLERAEELFADRRRKKAIAIVDEQALFEQIGRLNVENDWRKKSCPIQRLNDERWWSLTTAS